jgi:hypothetical protein
MPLAGQSTCLVADPYKWYHRQGHGVTWAFFSHRDRQDLHIHPLGVTEFYGILSGKLEIYWRPYHASGASAWQHRVLSAGDWAEVGPLQWHIVHWMEAGHGVVFKAGPGPLAGVGRLGTAGKTNWDDSHGILPPEVRQLMEQLQ